MATLTTPILALPYPDGAERVMDGDNAIGALANAVEFYLDKLRKPLGFSGYATTPTAVAPSAQVVLPIVTETYDPGNMLDGTSINTPGTTTGWWLISLIVSVATATPSRQLHIRFMENGLEYLNFGWLSVGPSDGSLAVTFQVFLNAAKYYQIAATGPGDGTSQARIRFIDGTRIGVSRGSTLLEREGPEAKPAELAG